MHFFCSFFVLSFFCFALSLKPKTINTCFCHFTWKAEALLFLCNKQVSFCLPSLSPHSPHSHAPASGLGLSPTHLETRMCACVCVRGGRVCRTFIFWHGYPYPRFICSFACLQQRQRQQALVYLLVFHLDANTPPPHTLLSRALGKANPIPKPGSNVKYLYVHYNSSGPGRAGPGMSGSWMRVPLACWPENFSILCAAVNVKAWLRCLPYYPLPAPIHRLPFSMPRAHGHEDWSRPGRFKGACMRACDCNSNGIQCAINTHVL